ncbi:Crp/Fnr family transcriptional regulator [Porphyromonadaceae bacterium OttesenSCG-928-L07]|nr:Crp/Fnr family transcriptional regulator [Porphyromonadaceae bacterium OttesenSCG-928-L07]MDL2252080.1 Crp/Fnr family transcriptional regulator [Odoribacter sp. OttesenSCG-928-J03]MDL2330827.1 Crp/Fnr family transcriptional regulator [Odoribacter sp. OttesenSCG-928-A06]
MKIIKDSKIYDKLCRICVESPHSLLSELDDSAKAKIYSSIVCVSYKKGDIIYNEGDMPVALLSLVSGKVKIFKIGIGGREQIVRMAKPVGFIGYRAFFAEEAHIASAEALEDSIVCRIKTDVMFSIVHSNPDLAMNIIRALATDLGFSNRRTVTLTQKHIRGRLAEALLVLKDTYGYEEDGATLKVYLTREDIANLSNMTTANAIRTLSNFASEGIVELDGKKIKIINPDALDRINSFG